MIRTATWVSMAALLLTACGSGMSDLESYVAEVKARKSRNIEPIPQIAPYEPVEFVAEDRRDPFVPAAPDRDDASNALKPDINRNREALEEFPLDALQLLGTIQNGKQLYALIRAPDGVVHRITFGNHLGQNYGEVKRITDTQIDLVEIIPDGFGGFMERPASLTLPE